MCLAILRSALIGLDVSHSNGVGVGASTTRFDEIRSNLIKTEWKILRPVLQILFNKIQRIRTVEDAGPYK